MTVRTANSYFTYSIVGKTEAVVCNQFSHLSQNLAVCGKDPEVSQVVDGTLFKR